MAVVVLACYWKAVAKDIYQRCRVMVRHSHNAAAVGVHSHWDNAAAVVPDNHRDRAEGRVNKVDILHRNNQVDQVVVVLLVHEQAMYDFLMECSWGVAYQVNEVVAVEMSLL